MGLVLPLVLVSIVGVILDGVMLEGLLLLELEAAGGRWSTEMGFGH